MLILVKNHLIIGIISMEILGKKSHSGFATSLLMVRDNEIPNICSSRDIYIGMSMYVLLFFKKHSQTSFEDAHKPSPEESKSDTIRQDKSGYRSKNEIRPDPINLHLNYDLSFCRIFLDKFDVDETVS